MDLLDLPQTWWWRFGHVRPPLMPKSLCQGDLKFFESGRDPNRLCVFNSPSEPVKTMSSTMSGLVLPKQTKAFPMPTDQGVGFDDGEGIPPVEKTRQSSPCEAMASVAGRALVVRSIYKPSCLRKKQILGRHASTGVKLEPYNSLIKVKASRKTLKMVRIACRNGRIAQFY
jgi:hypothetical protein